MPFNIVGFSEATPGTGTVNVAPGVSEGLYTVIGDSIVVTPEASYIAGIYAAAVGTGGRVILRQPKEIDISNIKTDLTSAIAMECGFTNYFGRPIPIKADKLDALIVNAVDEIAFIAVVLSSGKMTQADLDGVTPTHVISGYGDTTLVAHTWTHVPITWNETLEDGTYEVVGMRAAAYSVAGVGIARLKIPGNMDWRPGVPCGYPGAAHLELQGQHTMPMKDWPIMGVSFNSTKQMPNAEFLNTGACVDQDIELQLVQVG